MDYCSCNKQIELEDGQDIDFRKGFLNRTIRICISCEYLYIFHCSFGDYSEGIEYDNFDGSFNDFYDKEELNSYIEKAKEILK